MRFKIATLVLTIVALVSASLAGQNPPPQQVKDLPIDEVIKRFTTAESANKAARTNYSFTQDVNLMTLGEGGSITGQFKRVSEIVLDNSGNRVEKISYFPPSTLTVTITKEDLYDLANVQPFGLTYEDLPKYQVKYNGKEKIDELNTYVFDVKPKQFVKGERYLDGRIWVDDQDLQIVKIVGQAVPEDKNNQYPKFESYRENIDDKYWFPTYIAVDDNLEFKFGDVHIKGTIKITNYKKFSTGIRVADDPGEIEHDEKALEKTTDKTTDKTKKPETQNSTDKKTDPTKKPETPVKKKPDSQ